MREARTWVLATAAGVVGFVIGTAWTIGLALFDTGLGEDWQGVED